MVIVEGPDGAGKTTLISRLQQDFLMPVAPRVVTKEANALVNLVDWVEENLAGGLQQVIYDRHRLISEPIYGPVLRQTMEPGFDDMEWLYAKQREIRELEPFVIFCLPPPDQVYQNVMDDEDNKVVQDHIKTIYWLYFHLASTWERCSSVWDYTQGDYEWLTGEIEGWIDGREFHG